MRGQDEVVIARMNLEIEHGHGGQSVLQSFPVLAAVEGDEQAEFRSGEQQVGIGGIFANHVHRPGCRRDAIGDFGPRVAVVFGGVNVDGEISAAVVVEGHVDRTFLFVGSLDAADVGALGHAGHVARHVGPRLAAVARDLKIAVIGAGIEHSRAHRRFGDRGDTRPGHDAIVKR